MAPQPPRATKIPPAAPPAKKGNQRAISANHGSFERSRRTVRIRPRPTKIRSGANRAARGPAPGRGPPAARAPGPARRADRLAAVAAQARKLGAAMVEVIEADLARRDAPAKIFAQTEALRLQIDYLVNNAGFGPSGRFDHPP